MEPLDNVPQLLKCIYGESAEKVAAGGVSERMMRWCWAFDDWLDDFGRRLSEKSFKRLLFIWNRFLGFCEKPPWLVTTADVNKFSEWMHANRRSPRTITRDLYYIGNFYNWCNNFQIDPESPPGFNPVLDANKPVFDKFDKSQILSHAEAQALLDVFKKDTWVLSKRDYAFFLCQLNLGITAGVLRKLQWDQIRVDDTGTWIDLGLGRPPIRLVDEAWQAILTYLRASSRLTDQRNPPDEAYIFAVVRNLISGDNYKTLEHWIENRAVGTRQIHVILNRYGEMAGIAPEKLNLATLRHTAIAWRLEAGDSNEQLQVFMGGIQKKPVQLLRRMVQRMMDRQAGKQFEPKEPAFLPLRKGGYNLPQATIKHGAFAGSQSPEELEAVMAENISGLDLEIGGMRMLERRLVDGLSQTTDKKEMADLMDMATRAGVWLGTMAETERAIQEQGEIDKEFVGWSFKVFQVECERMGEKFDPDEAQAQALQFNPEYEVENRRLMEEIATARLVVRRSLKLGLETKVIKELVQYTRVFGYTCLRLTRLLEMQGNECSLLAAFLRSEFDRARAELLEEMSHVEWWEGKYTKVEGWEG